LYDALFIERHSTEIRYSHIVLNLSTEQQSAFDLIGKFKKDSTARVAVLTGFAGSGKTSLLKPIAEAYGPVVALTPTGKAALRVFEATGIPAGTIHRRLYLSSTDKKTGNPVFRLRILDGETPVASNTLIVVDEASMVDKKLWADILSTAQMCSAKVLLVGDTFQLPPVAQEGDQWCALDVETPYRANLLEVHRQAADNPIYAASTILRSKAPIYKALHLLRPMGESELVPCASRLGSEGVVIVYTNARRHQINNAVRERLGYAPETIMPREPLLVLHNNYELDRYNGEVVYFDRWKNAPDFVSTGVVRDRWNNTALEMSFGKAAVDQSDVILSPQEISGKSHDNKVSTGAIKAASRAMVKRLWGNETPHLHCNYGYAATCHKMQGSEHPEVIVVLDDKISKMGAVMERRWMYTAVTRARKVCSYVYLRA